MSTQTEVRRYIPSSELVRNTVLQERTTLGMIKVDGVTYPHLETPDFPKSDPWSRQLRKVIEGFRRSNSFKGEMLTELGIGDGRNIREAGSGLLRVVGVDIEEWRVQTAAVNLITGSHPIDAPVDLYVGDAVDFLRGQKEDMSGWVLMCLPQSPEGINSADRYDGLGSLDSYRRDWEYSGLTLNAAALDSLRAVSDANLRALVILSDRVPDEIKSDLFFKTGWQIENKFSTAEPVQQDPDTGISWVSKIDDGRRFYEKSHADFRPISAVEAEARRQESLASGKGREKLNVYHGLTVYNIKPR